MNCPHFLSFVNNVQKRVVYVFLHTLLFQHPEQITLLVQSPVTFL